MYDIDQKKMLKHGCTRWLSIGRCLDRLIENWVPLCALFRKEQKLIDEEKEKKRKKAGSTEVSNTTGTESVQQYAHKKVQTICDF